MIMEKVFRSFVSKISVYHSIDDVFLACKSKAYPGKGLNISFLNAHAFNVGCRDQAFVRGVMESDLVLRDGIGVKLLYKLLKLDPGLNLNGTDLIPLLLENVFKEERIAIFGSTDKELEVVDKKLTQKGFNIVGSLDGFQTKEDYLKKTAEIKPSLVIIAMGMPKQEYIASALREHFDDLSTINGGAIIDFMAGKVNRAPVWVRRMGLEWAYRLLQEPKRMFKRYIVGNVLFMCRALRLLKKTTPLS